VPRLSPVLVLDLDGTLVDTVPDMAAALNRLMAERGLAAFSHPETASMVGDGVAKLVERAFAARGKVPDADAVGDFSRDYTSHVAVDSRLYPGVLPALQAMAAEGWRFAVCTNKPEAAARALLAAVGLAPLIAAVGGGDSFPVRKPEPEHLRATLHAAGGEAGRAVMAGDHANDVIAATGVGIPCIFAAWGYGKPAMAAGAAAIAQNVPEMAGIARRLVNQHKSG
jgi:phosphoglycolate phosphatase